MLGQQSQSGATGQADDCDIALDQFGYNPATDQLLQDIEQDDHEEALDNDEHPLREPSYRSGRWFALRKDQLVYSDLQLQDPFFWGHVHEES
ncbi:hypothetical protein WJX77_000509 [Trebouxia sp. C0004]